MGTQTATPQDESLHHMYKRLSPTYNEILATRGRYLGPLDVTLILGEHGVSVVDYLKDHISVVLPERTDAAELLGWLGY